MKITNFSLKKNSSLLFIGAALTAAIALAAFTIPDAGRMEQWFNRSTYYFIALLFGVWLWVCCETAAKYRHKLQDVLIENRYGLLFSLALAAAVFISVPPVFRVMMDQPELVNVSKSMTFERRTDIVIEGYRHQDNYQPYSRYIEKRPFLFPFLAHIVHVVSGYRPENSFVVNFVVLFALFSLSFIFASRLAGAPWGYVTVILLASQPLVTQNAASGGFELLQSVLFLVVVASLGWYLKMPTPDRLCFLWAQNMVFINTRYESIILSAGLFLMMLCFKRIPWRHVQKNLPIYSLTPLLLLPFLWQRLLVSGITWNYNDGERPEGAKVFALEHALKHSVSFIEKALSVYSELPYAGLVNIAGIAGMILFAALFFSRRAVIRKPDRQLVWIGGALTILFWMIITCYFYSSVDRPHTSRFYLTFVITLSFFASYLMSRLKSQRTPLAAVLLSLGCFLLYHPVSVENKHSNSHYLTREYKLIVDHFKRQPDKDFLIIYDWPIVLTVYDFGAISFGTANRDPEGAVLSRLKNHSIREAFVVQRMRNRILSERSRLDRIFRLETVAEMENGRNHSLRISKVILDASPQPS